MSAAGPLVIGTAGHVDHGKTALVLALTGRDTDRLPEEKARGISITLGFAPLEVAGRPVSLVDVPGHERFVRHMVAGASGVDGYLLCVAADDGVMPQTREHMAVLELLGVRDGVVAVTKADVLDPALAAEEARALVGDGPEIVPVSAVSGAGLDDLRRALARLVTRLSRRTARGAPRLFVDRVFSVPGAGTVVTGTLWGGTIAVGDRVRVVPADAPARVRGVEAHDVAVTAAAGGRVALNLVGIERDAAPRGSCVVRADDPWTSSPRLDVTLTWLPDAGGPLRSRRRLQAFLGTAELGATCVLLAGDELPPGGRGYAQLRLDGPVVATAGDRIVLRSAERRTVGGAVVVDPAPERHGRGEAIVRRLTALEAGDAGAVLALDLERAGPRGLRPVDPAGAVAAGGEALAGGWVVGRDLAVAARAAVAARLGDGLAAGEARRATGLDGEVADALIATLEQEGALRREGGRVLPPGRPAPDPVAAAVAGLLRGAGLRPPAAAELVEETGLEPERLAAILTDLRDRGEVVAAGDLWFDAGAASDAAARAEAALVAGGLGIGELRDLWGVGRRHALALAAYLDGTGLTRRVGDVRVLRGSAGRGAPPAPDAAGEDPDPPAGTV
jgi:selenocysteine-specific elongation factor